MLFIRSTFAGVGQQHGIKRTDAIYFISAPTVQYEHSIHYCTVLVLNRIYDRIWATQMQSEYDYLRIVYLVALEVPTPTSTC